MSPTLSPLGLFLARWLVRCTQTDQQNKDENEMEWNKPAKSKITTENFIAKFNQINLKFELQFCQSRWWWWRRLWRPRCLCVCV